MLQAASAIPAAAGQPTDNILVAENVSKRFGGFLAVSNLNLAVRRGSIHALIGPNGAGKTTCFNLLTKALALSSGRIMFNGSDISDLRSAAVAKRGLVRSFQISATFPNLTVLENVRVALQAKHGKSYHFWRSIHSIDSLNARALELIGEVGLSASQGVTAAELSYGKKRALEIATTLALEPELLLLDEPTAGMGHEDIEPITDLIRRVAVGRTVLLVEHNLSVVSTLCDRITVLQHGQIIADGTYAEVSANPLVRTAYLGEDDA
ncbi:ABC transporter ATP-binding protein [Rhizobium alvei]|uniref:ABC transporter ATP-binding protein n=1 Tax=Rhizobium alvei TaxID=1132659 RepID=A0ABT8YPF7_9HYPH|nr:ABC transporter ATP-binding protein [Rhizobium alvei]MDO6965080.1 ABC transporter ATP-binding protein [Rhizobium alvei]